MNLPDGHGDDTVARSGAGSNAGCSTATLPPSGPKLVKKRGRPKGVKAAAGMEAARKGSRARAPTEIYTPVVQPVVLQEWYLSRLDGGHSPPFSGELAGSKKQPPPGANPKGKANLMETFFGVSRKKSAAGPAPLSARASTNTASGRGAVRFVQLRQCPMYHLPCQIT
jgi:hypothetical protein